VYLPADDMLAGCPAVLVVMPGGGYSRHYFDLPVPGYSQAEHHVRQGTVVVAIDHLGAGDSSIPPMQLTTLPTVAAANHAAVSAIVGQLHEGTVAPGIPPVDLACVVGAGQSLGGYALLGMQAGHRTFDAVAMLGSSLAGTTLPARPGVPESVVPDGTAPEQAAQLALANADWNWVFHWEDITAPDTSRPPRDLASLVAADVAGGLPVRRTTPEWGSLTWPGFVLSAMLPGAVADEAARIDVPVLLATGERDVCHPPAEEVAALKSATDISVLVVPRMAHMHNFATTRTLLWERLDEFVTHVTRTTAARGTSR
jgi:pimeloyl-ACP methyl ester carboxylesterase